jgi:PT repeat
VTSQHPPQGPPPSGPPPSGPPAGGPPYGPPGPHQGPPGQYGPPPGGGGRSKGVVAAVILGILLVVGGAVTAGILLLGGDSDDEAGPTDPEPTSEPTVCGPDEDEVGCTPPTEEPTEEPTGEPTEQPTGELTEEPTGEPTEEPVAGGPAEAVQEFVDAIRDNDCPAAISYLTRQAIKQTDASCEDFDTTGLEKIEYGTPQVVEESGDTAKVGQSVSFDEVDEELTLVYEMVSQDGQWLIDDFGSPEASPSP